MICGHRDRLFFSIGHTKGHLLYLPLNYYLLAHGTINSKKCGYCELTFKKQKELKSHVVEKHKKMRNKCFYCEKSFNVDRPIDLKRYV